MFDDFVMYCFEFSYTFDQGLITQEFQKTLSIY